MSLLIKHCMVITLTLMVLTACAPLSVTRVDVQSFAVVKKNVKPETAINTVSTALVDRNFDIKLVNKDAGIVTTEFKKYASIGTNPPFDYFMQIKGRIKGKNGLTTIELVPSIREQNRMNAGAFTEHMLGYYVGNPNQIQSIGSMRAGTGWRGEGQTLFMNVVAGVAEAFGVRVDDVVQNVTKTNVDIMMNLEGKQVEIVRSGSVEQRNSNPVIPSKEAAINEPTPEKQPKEIASPQSIPINQSIEKKSQSTAEPQSTSSTPTSMTVTGNKAKIRKKPSTKAAVVKTIKKGEVVQVIKQSDEWFQVELVTGDVGWCHKSVLVRRN